MINSPACHIPIQKEYKNNIQIQMDQKVLNTFIVCTCISKPSSFVVIILTKSTTGIFFKSK